MLYLQYTYEEDSLHLGFSEGQAQREKAWRVVRGSPDDLYDDNARFESDPDHSEDEDRFILMGMSTKLRILVVCHCYRSDDEEIRLISARKATKRERKQYEELLP